MGIRLATAAVSKTISTAPLTLSNGREVMSVEEVAEFLGVSVSLIRTNINVIPHKRLGTRLLFGRDAVLNWVNNGQNIE